MENKGNYTYKFMNEESGKYNITASKNGSEVKGWTQIETVNLLYSHFNIWLLMAGAFFLGLLFLLLLTSHKYKDKFHDKKEPADPIDKNSSRKLLAGDLSFKYHLHSQGISDQNSENEKEQFQENSYVNLEIPEIVRFICISGMVFSVISAFIFTDVEIGTNSPIGLAIMHNLNPHAENDFDRNGNPVNEWIINIGGNWSNNFSSGIVIPVYVVIFGILGGYLRYLYKAASKEEKTRS